MRLIGLDGRAIMRLIVGIGCNLSALAATRTLPNARRASTRQASSALITGFVAKEVVVGNMAQSFAVEEPEDPHDAGTLGEKIRTNFDQSSGGHGKAAALAFLVFVLAYTPCLATLAEQRRMLGFKITGAALIVQLALAAEHYERLGLIEVREPGAPGCSSCPGVNPEADMRPGCAGCFSHRSANQAG